MTYVITTAAGFLTLTVETSKTQAHNVQCLLGLGSAGNLNKNDPALMYRYGDAPRSYLHKVYRGSILLRDGLQAKSTELGPK